MITCGGRIKMKAAITIIASQFKFSIHCAYMSENPYLNDHFIEKQVDFKIGLKLSLVQYTSDKQDTQYVMTIIKEAGIPFL